MAQVFPSEISATDVATMLATLSWRTPGTHDGRMYLDFDLPSFTVSIWAEIAPTNGAYDLKVRRDVEDAIGLLPHVHSWVAKSHSFDRPNDIYDMVSMHVDGDELYVEYTARNYNSGLWGHSFRRSCFGNPFHSVAFAPEWRTETVTGVTRLMHEKYDFSAMPILADALQEAGCDNEDVLNHCRGSNSHKYDSGCWVVKLILGIGAP